MFRAVAMIFIIATGAAMAQQYDPGASATEIKLGQTVPFSGPVSVAGVVGHASLAYFDAVNKAGGINGRQVKLIALDDGYIPPKTVEATRRLVEDDNVLMMYGSVGTPTNAAVEKYLNVKKVPQLFITTGRAASGIPRHFPGPWRSCPATWRKAGRWGATYSKPSPRPRSRCSTRTTISARIFGPDFVPASAIRPTP
jgi:branched-chain amino acid transport system substrate-binding protein